VFIPEAAERAARHSVVFFCNCDFDAEVAPLADGGGGAASALAAAASKKGGGGVEGATTAGHYILEKLGLMFLAK
jgi:hypothetical protein